MIRVLQFADIINRYDFIDNIVQWADSHKFEIGVCVRSAQSNIASPDYSQGIFYRATNGKSRRDIPAETIRLVHILQEWKPHILHTHHYDQAVIGWLATRFYPKTRLVIGRHYSNSIYRSSKGINRALLLAIEQRTNRAAARIIVPSTNIFQILVQWQKVQPNKLDIVPYGFVPAKYTLIDSQAIESLRRGLGLEGRVVLGTFGRLHEEKGQRFLIEAVARLKEQIHNIILLIAGEGPERKNLERQIVDAGLGEHVKLLGWRRDTMALMAAVDIVVQPTLQEAFSQVMAEALWMSKPLVITNVSGASDVITDGVNGLIVPPADVPALITAIRRLVLDKPYRVKMGTLGKRHVQEHLTIEKVIPRYEQAYLRALEQGNI